MKIEYNKICESCGKPAYKVYLKEEFKTMKTAKQTTHTALDNVCIMQKYHDSENIEKCSLDFKESEQFIIQSVNNHTALVEAIEDLIEYIEHDKEHPEAKAILNSVMANANEALKQAKGE